MSLLQPGIGFPTKHAPDAIVLSGPEFYKSHITALYGGYKRTRDLYGKATYQKDPDQDPDACGDGFIYWSVADARWCIGPVLGAAIQEAQRVEIGTPCSVPIHQATQDDAPFPCLLATWVVNLYGTGARSQADHMLTLEALELPRDAADRDRAVGGYMHISVRKFVDYEFPPNSTSLEGQPPPMRLGPLHRAPVHDVTWVPATQMANQMGGPLFEGTCEPSARWLHSIQPNRGGIYPVLAAICEYPGHMESLFTLSPCVNPMGRYQIWLFNVWQSQWQLLTVDEYVPVYCDEAGSLWPWGGGHGRTLWVLLLEKALARMCGSYEALHRYENGPLLMMLTGERSQVCHWVRDGCWWSQWSFILPELHCPAPSAADKAANVHKRVRESRPLRCAMQRVGGTWHQAHELFQMLRDLHRSNALLLVYSDAGLDRGGERNPGRADPSCNGLVQGHGYSILQLVEVEGESLHLAQLRNVWSPGFEWNGPWSEGSVEWAQFPEIRKHYSRPEHRNSGRFWMPWPDVCALFDRVEVCPMPQSARKASFVPRISRKARQVHGALGNGALGDGSGFASSLFPWKCCAVERTQHKLVV